MTRIIGCTTVRDGTAERGIRSSDLTRRNNKTPAGVPLRGSRRYHAESPICHERFRYDERSRRLEETRPLERSPGTDAPPRTYHSGEQVVHSCPVNSAEPNSARRALGLLELAPNDLLVMSRASLNVMKRGLPGDSLRVVTWDAIHEEAPTHHVARRDGSVAASARCSCVGGRGSDGGRAGGGSYRCGAAPVGGPVRGGRSGAGGDRVDERRPVRA